MFEKGKDIQLALQEDHRQREDREAKSRILSHVTENQGLGLVEGSTLSKTKNKTANRGGADNVEAPALTTRERIRRALSDAARDERT
jgi:hypothetical protein